MDDIRNVSEPGAAPVLSAADQSELDWAQVLDCGALGPSPEAPQLFHQGAEDWEAQ